MGITSLQVCMDSSDWFQGTMSEENAGIITDDCSSPITTPSGEDNSNNILTCSRPLLETRRLRPQHEQSLKCPRCESTHTKFCYYNNYSLSQPRYFCKTCRRYWTKGGTLRNIPVGGGCRKNNKKPSSSKKTPPSSSSSPPSSSSSPSMNILHHHAATSALLSSSYNMHDHNSNPNPNPNHIGGYNNSDHYSTAGLHLAFSDQLQFSSSLGFFNNHNNNNLLLDQNPVAPIDFMENNYVGNFNGEDFGGMMSNGNFHGGHAAAPATILESCQRLMMPYDDGISHDHRLLDHEDRVVDVKPSGSKILSLEWHDHHQQQQVGYNFGGLGSWTGLMNGYGSSATNPLV